MKAWVLTAASAAALCSASAGFAVTPEIILSRVEGKVLVDGADGPQLSLPGKQLNPGTNIFVGAESQVDVYFPASECTLKIVPSSIVTVPAVSPCAAGQAWMAATHVTAQPTADVPVDPSVGDPAADPNGLGTALVVGGVAAVAVGAIILLNDDNEDGRPGFPVSQP